MLVERICEGIADEQRLNKMLVSGVAVPSVAAADCAAAADPTATLIAAAVPAAAPAGGAGAAAGAWETAALRDAAIATINGMRTHSIEVELDLEALIADVADIRAKYAVAVTLNNEDKARTNALLASLRAQRIIAT